MCKHQRTAQCSLVRFVFADDLVLGFLLNPPSRKTRKTVDTHEQQALWVGTASRPAVEFFGVAINQQVCQRSRNLERVLAVIVELWEVVRERLEIVVRLSQSLDSITVG